MIAGESKTCKMIEIGTQKDCTYALGNTVLIRGTIIKFRGHRGFNTEFSSPESPVCTTAVHCHNMNREMVVYKSVWTQRHKKDQRSEISTTGLRSRISEGPRAFAGSALSECHFLVLVVFLCASKFLVTFSFILWADEIFLLILLRKSEPKQGFFHTA